MTMHLSGFTSRRNALKVEPITVRIGGQLVKNRHPTVDQHSALQRVALVCPLRSGPP
jgi:hypothetical protein